MDIDDYIVRAKSMIKSDEARDILFAGIDDMWHGNFKLPSDLGNKPDLRTIVDLSPHDALKSGTAILSTSMPNWTVQPLLANPAEQDRAERTAYAIDYNYRQINKRGKSTILWDMVHSCLRYDAIAVWLDYLPYQFKGKQSLRQKHALRKGDFAVTVYNPRNVHIQEDAYGPNCVLLSTNITAQEVVNKWWNRTGKLKLDLKNMDDDGTSRFAYNDMMIYEDDKIRRIVWGNFTDSDTNTEADDSYVIMNEEIPIPFMPWVVRVGGTSLEQSAEYTVHPLLAPLHYSKKWKDLCVFQSILQSEIIKYGRTPRVKTITPSGDGVEIDYEDGTTLNLKTGEEADAWRPSPIDPNLKELVDRVRSEVSASTLPRILQNPEFAGNTPFASINAMIQTALGGLNPAKVLCQGAHEELAIKMVEWCQFMKRPLIAYRSEKNVTEGIEPGTNASLQVEEMDADSMLVSCRLFAEAPTDFNQRLQAGVLMNKQLKVPRAEILQDLGKVNPDALYEQWVQEQYDDSTVANDLQMEQMKIQAAFQMQMQAAQMQMQQAMQPQQPTMQQTNNKLGGMMPSGEGMNAGSGEEMSPGMGAGNSLPQQGLPGVSSREMVSGQDVTGAAIA